jgi:hypothetical protein
MTDEANKTIRDIEWIMLMYSGITDEKEARKAAAAIYEAGYRKAVTAQDPVKQPEEKK